jgi:hypothetical protein
VSKDLWAIAVATTIFLAWCGWNVADALIASMP